MKKILLFIAVGLITYSVSYSQARTQLNFGLIGASYDIPVADDISVAPLARTNFGLDYLVVGVKGDYYFDNLIGLPSEWDLYGGANAGYRLWIGDKNDFNNGKDNGDLDLGLQFGGRWFWNEKWGINLELSGGVGYGGMLGLTMKL